MNVGWNISFLRDIKNLVPQRQIEQLLELQALPAALAWPCSLSWSGVRESGSLLRSFLHFLLFCNQGGRHLDPVVWLNERDKHLLSTCYVSRFFPFIFSFPLTTTLCNNLLSPVCRGGRWDSESYQCLVQSHMQLALSRKVVSIEALSWWSFPLAPGTFSWPSWSCCPKRG